MPPPAVVRGIERLDVTIRSERRAVLLARPDEVVGVDGMEVEHGEAEAVGWEGRVERVPGFAGVGGVVVLLRLGDEVGAVVAVSVHVEGDELLVGEDLLPVVAFAA